MSTSILRLAGGLGNQIFQFGVGVAKLHTPQDSLHLDTSSLSKYKTKRVLELNKIFDFSLIPNLHISNKGKLVSNLRAGKIMNMTNKVIATINDKNVLQHDFRKASRFNLIDGYFTYSQNRQNLNNLFSRLSKLLKKSMLAKEQEDICYVHIRGTDAINTNVNILGRDYYSNAILHAKQLNPNLSFVVITDDISYAQEQFKNNEIKEFRMGSMVDDFKMILNANNVILSNSTFCISASLLGSKIQKKNITIGPDRWDTTNKIDLNYKEDF